MPVARHPAQFARLRQGLARSGQLLARLPERVNTPYGVPAPVRTVHGSNSSDAANELTSRPPARSDVLSPASTSRSGAL